MRLFIFLLFFSTTSHSANPFKYVLKEMRDQNYAYALVKLKNMKGTPSFMEKRYFLEARCLTNLGDPKESLRRLKRIKTKIKGLDFELGKAFYFYGNLNEAEKYFISSNKLGYKKAEGLHYLGNIKLKKKEYRFGKAYFEDILKIKMASDWIIQDSYFKIGDIHLTIAKNDLLPQDMGPILKKHVIPYFTKAIQISPDSKVANRARKKIYLVKTKYDVD